MSSHISCRRISVAAIFEADISTGTKEPWDYGTSFKHLIDEDTAAWKKLGVDRPPLLVKPSGSIKSPLAIHLLNPTFHVADSQSTVTDDPTNPTIQILRECGLSSEHCFMFDEICRRERTDDCLLFYTENLRRPHREFSRVIRENMHATVEICFGEEVFKEISKSAHLVRFPLWGMFKSVRLWLEFDDPNLLSMRRFVIQAYHPQFFSRPGRFDKSNPEFLEAYAKPQDLAISMATQLAGLSHQIKLKSNFFAIHFRRGRYARLSTEQDQKRREHIRHSQDAFKRAFPESFKEYELRQVRRREEQNLVQGFQEFPSELFIHVHADPDGPLTEQQKVSRGLRFEPKLTLTRAFGFMQEGLIYILPSFLSRTCLMAHAYIMTRRLMILLRATLRTLRIFQLSSGNGFNLRMDLRSTVCQ